MSTLRSKLIVAALVISGAAFIFLGASKVLDPSGTAPRLFRELGFDAELSLRAVGVLEVLIGALIVGRTRVLGLLSAIVFVVGTMFLVALHADDPDFLKDCGCMGSMAAAQAESDRHEPLLLRNSAILLPMLALFVCVQRKGRRVLMGAITGGVVLSMIASTFYLGEVVRHQETLRLATLDRVGYQRHQAIGWELPDLVCRVAKGGEISAQEVGLRSIVEAHDQIIVYSVDCPYCVSEAADWKSLSAQLRARGRKLVLVCASATPERFRRFQARLDLGEIDSLVLAERSDLSWLGVKGVPAMLEVQGDGVVVSAPGVKRTQPFFSTLGHLLDEFPDLGSVLWRSLAESLPVATEASQDVRHVRGPGYLLIHSGPGNPFLVIAGSPTASDAYVELALLLSPGGQISQVRVLALRSPHATLIEPADLVRMLASKTVNEGRELMDARKVSNPMDAHVAQMVNSILLRAQGASDRWIEVQK